MSAAVTELRGARSITWGLRCAEAMTQVIQAETPSETCDVLRYEHSICHKTTGLLIYPLLAYPKKKSF